MPENAARPQAGTTAPTTDGRPGPADGRPRRADARRNYDQILAAAEAEIAR